MTNVRLHKYIWFCCDCITNIVCSTGCTSDYAEIVEEEGDYSTPMSKFLTSQFRGDSKEILSVNLIVTVMLMLFLKKQCLTNYLQ